MTDLERAARWVLVGYRRSQWSDWNSIDTDFADLSAALDQQPPTSCAACEVEFGKIGACTLNDAKRHLEVFRCRIAVGVRCVCGAHVSDVMEAEEKS